tara:strand:+ start:1578 stop:1916 length:339 start_codon:yes stop_codon:yes gene_type:complete
MKKNVKYVKNVLDNIKNEARKHREKLFYSIGVISILLIFVNRYATVNKEIETIKTNKQSVKTINKEIIKEKKKKTMSFKEKFKASRAYHGKNGLFVWNGRTYHCKYKEEMEE